MFKQPGFFFGISNFALIYSKHTLCGYNEIDVFFFEKVVVCVEKID